MLEQVDATIDAVADMLAEAGEPDTAVHALRRSADEDGVTPQVPLLPSSVELLRDAAADLRQTEQSLRAAQVRLRGGDEAGHPAAADEAVDSVAESLMAQAIAGRGEADALDYLEQEGARCARAAAAMRAAADAGAVQMGVLQAEVDACAEHVDLDEWQSAPQLLTVEVEGGAAGGTLDTETLAEIAFAAASFLNGLNLLVKEPEHGYPVPPHPDGEGKFALTVRAGDREQAYMLLDNATLGRTDGDMTVRLQVVGSVPHVGSLGDLLRSAESAWDRLAD